jgi:hypothetical protein
MVHAEWTRMKFDSKRWKPGILMNSVSRKWRNCLFALAMGVMPVVPVVAAPTFSIVAPVQVPLGEPFEIDVVASDMVDLYAYQFDLVFDPTRLQYVDGAFEGAFLSTAGPTFFFEGIPSPGSIQFVFDSLIGPGPGAAGGGVLARFDFIGVDRGLTTLSLANVLALDTSGNLIDVQLASADVTIPEPGTLGLLALALTGCVAALRRKGASRG